MKRRPLVCRGEKGFTLVELMVIVAIVAALIGFTYTGFSGTLERQRCQAAIKRINWLLKQAQMQAIEKHTSCSVRATASSNTIQIFLDRDENLVLGGNDTLLENLNIGQEFHGVRLTQDSNFRFGSRGIPKGGIPSTIQIAAQDSSSYPEEGNITITNVGRINVQMPECWKY